MNAPLGRRKGRLFHFIFPNASRSRRIAGIARGLGAVFAAVGSCRLALPGAASGPISIARQRYITSFTKGVTMSKALKKGVSFAIALGLVLLVAAAGSFAFSIPGFGKYQKVKPVNGLVSIPVVKVNDGKAHFFRLSDGGRDLNFFVVKSSDGVYHTAFDACDVCYKEKKGYVQQGDQMLCKNCNQKFAVQKIGPSSAGGCNPAYLPSKIYGNSITISVADLKTGSRFF